MSVPQVEDLPQKAGLRQAGRDSQRIIDGYPEEIRADNALFELAELYETHLNDRKGQRTVRKLFIDYFQFHLCRRSP
jgi:hypothetical protein